MAGENLSLVGNLHGHRRHQTTAGYTHLADANLIEAAEKVGSLIADTMNPYIVQPPHRLRERHRYGRLI